MKAKSDHSMIYTGQQAQSLQPSSTRPSRAALFPPNMCPVASWPHKQEPACCFPALNSSSLSAHLSDSGQNQTFNLSNPIPLSEYFYSYQITFPFFNWLLKPLFRETEVFFQLSKLFFLVISACSQHPFVNADCRAELRVHGAPSLPP